MLPIRLQTILYHDEIFDVKPIKQLSLGCSYVDPTLNTPLLFGCIPLWSSNGYQGTLRALLLFPLIEIHQLKPTTVLLLNSILIGLTSYSLLNLTRKIETSRHIRIFLLSAVLLQPLIWSLFVFDLGPVTTQVLLKTLIIVSVWSDLKSGRFFGPATTIFSILLVWGKLDGLWFVIGLILARSLCLKRKDYKKLFSGYFITLIIFSSFGIKFAMDVRRYIPATNNQDFFSKVFVQLPRDLSNGVMSIVISNYKSISGVASVPIMLLSLISLFSFFFNQSSKESLLFLFYRIIRLQLLITLSIFIYLPEATAPWHTVSILPSVQVLIFLWFLLIRKNLETSNKLLKLKGLIVLIAAIALITNSIVSLTQIKSLNTENIKPLYSKSLADAFNQINPVTENSRAWVLTSWGLYNPLIMDDSFDHKTEITKVFDFWNPFEIKNEKKRNEYISWAMSKGPLAEFQNFTFVEYQEGNPLTGVDYLTTLGSNGELNNLIKEFGLCDLQKSVFTIRNTKSKLFSINARRC
jgi:hypothetical protein